MSAPPIEPSDARWQALVDALRDAPERGDWFYDGRDIFTEEHGPDGHRLILPLPETFHASQQVPDSVARLIVAAVNYARAACGASQAASISGCGGSEGEA